MPSTNPTHLRRLARRLADATDVGYQEALRRVRAASTANRLPRVLDGLGMAAALESLIVEGGRDQAEAPVPPAPRQFPLGRSGDGGTTALALLRHHDEAGTALPTPGRVPVDDVLRADVAALDDERSLLVSVAGAFISVCIAAAHAGVGFQGRYHDPGEVWEDAGEVFHMAQLLRLDVVDSAAASAYYNAIDVADEVIRSVAIAGDETSMLAALARVDALLSTDAGREVIVRLGQVAHLCLLLAAEARTVTVADLLNQIEDRDAFSDATAGRSYAFNAELDRTTVAYLTAALTGDPAQVVAAIDGIVGPAIGVVLERAAVLIAAAIVAAGVDPRAVLDAAASDASGHFSGAPDIDVHVADAVTHLSERAPFGPDRPDGTAVAVFETLKGYDLEQVGAFVVVCAVVMSEIVVYASEVLGEEPVVLIGRLAADHFITKM